VNYYFWVLLNAALKNIKLKMLLRNLETIKCCSDFFLIEHKILFKMLLPDDIRDLAGRAINFSKKAGI
jgi:hypothetical protein